MGQRNTPPARAAIGQGGLRIVLFGRPHAGKSSLLGALAQAAATQGDLLHWQLADIPAPLAELCQRLYENRPRRTEEEIVPYPVTFTPHARSRHRPLEAVLIDCDGRSALELLARQPALEGSPDGSLAQALLHADTVVLVVAATDPEPDDTDFQQLQRFLTVLEQQRGQRSDIGGLPVFLVLSKCDLLAQKQDSFADWIDRIEERKRAVHQRFQHFVRQAQVAGPSPFGHINLYLAATATGRPELAHTPADPRRPYGVAELFRQCLERASDFRRRYHRSNRWLYGTLAAAVSSVTLMLGLALFFVVQQWFGPPAGPPLVTPLDQRQSLAAALGLFPTAKPPVLRQLSEKGDLRAADARHFREQLALHYPDHADWRRADLPPDPDADKILAKVGHYLLEAGRDEVARQIERNCAGNRAGIACWRSVVQTLPETMRDWRELARLVQRLRGTPAPDPIEELQAFVQKEQHPLQLRQWTLAIPKNDWQIEPDGFLEINHESAGMNRRYTFHEMSPPKQEEERTIHTFVPRGAFSLPLTVTYQPGEKMFAELNVKTSKGDQKLIWRVAPPLYQFDCLTRPPQLASRPALALTGVVLLPDQGSVLPSLPALLPRLPAAP
ncbi:MAG: hypothetical protein ACK4RK_04135 [Gemmataceae bacterium]